MNTKNDWRERMKEKRQALVAARRAALSADERVQAIKRALKDRAKQRRKQIAAEQKERRQLRALDERTRRDAELRELVHPATTPRDP
jgi:hypothetical protein